MFEEKMKLYERVEELERKMKVLMGLCDVVLVELTALKTDRRSDKLIHPPGKRGFGWVRR